MLRHRYKIHKMVFLFLLVGLAACSVLPIPPASTPTPTMDPTYLDMSWLSGIPCEPPCWNELELEESTPEDVYAFVHSSRFFDTEKIEDSSKCWVWYYPELDTDIEILVKDGRCIFLICKDMERNACAHLAFVEDRLAEIQLYPQDLVTFKEVVDVYGKPDSMNIYPIHHSNYCEAQLLYREYQMKVVHTDDNKKRCQEWFIPFMHSGKIPSSLTVSNVYIMSAGYFLDVRDTLWKGFSEE